MDITQPLHATIISMMDSYCTSTAAYNQHIAPFTLKPRSAQEGL